MWFIYQNYLNVLFDSCNSFWYKEVFLLFDITFTFNSASIIKARNAKFEWLHKNKNGNRSIETCQKIIEDITQEVWDEVKLTKNNFKN